MKVWPYVTVLLGANFFVARAASDTARACFDQGPACRLTKDLAEGPYYLQDRLTFRSNLTEGQGGVALELVINVRDPDCQPLPGVIVDIWQSNATGIYSGYTGYAPNVRNCSAYEKGLLPGLPPCGLKPSNDSQLPPEHAEPTDSLTFLRGVMLTNEAGVASFQTVIPGWYTGRAPHVHIKVRAPSMGASAANGKGYAEEWAGSYVVHTGQLFFPDSLFDALEHLPPYTDDIMTRTFNNQDKYYRNDTTQTLPITQNKPDQLPAGVTSSITAVVDQHLSDIAPVHLLSQS